MKSIKIYLLPIFLLTLFNTQVFSQDDFYNNKKEKQKLEQTDSRADSIIVHEYFTEEDYNEKHNVANNKISNDSEPYYGDEIYSSEEEKRRRERNNFFNEVAAEVVVEVIVNTLFIIATFWH